MLALFGKSKQYFNCIKKPCVKGGKVIDKIPPPPLHVCKLGPFNHVMKSLAKKCPKEVETFLNTVQVSKEKYHGGDFEGNEVDKCLKNMNILEELIDDEYFDFIAAFESIKELNEQVAGKTLKCDYDKAIDKFTVNFLNLNINHGVSKTPKIHIITDHVKKYCEENKVSLGHYTDQTIEAIHQVVNSRFTASKYYTKFAEHDKHGAKLYCGIIHVNTYNI